MLALESDQIGLMPTEAKRRLGASEGGTKEKCGGNGGVVEPFISPALPPLTSHFRGTFAAVRQEVPRLRILWVTEGE